MSDISVQVHQIEDTPTSEGWARDHRVLIDRPEAKGGADQGPLGGEMLLLALGGCFMSNLIAAEKARELTVDGMSVTVHGELAEAPPRFAAITMEVHGTPDDEEAFARIIEISERACIVTNTLKHGAEVAVQRAGAASGA